MIFPEAAHEPALQLAAKLLKGVGKGWAQRVFFSDNGSTAIEVALKMAFRESEVKAAQRGEPKQPPSKGSFTVLGIEGSYHGDTIGSMQAASPNIFNEKTHWYHPRGLWLPSPTISLKKGTFVVEHPDHSKTESFKSLTEIFSEHRNRSASYAAHVEAITKAIADEEERGAHLGALLIEPVIHGSGGMVFIDPLFQRALVRVCKRRGIPVIYDEVFVGLYRLGPETTSTLLHEKPDIACYAKLLTGGITPIAATLTTEVFLPLTSSFCGSLKCPPLKTAECV